MSEEKINETNIEETNDANTEEVNEETSSKEEHIHEMPEHKEDEKIDAMKKEKKKSKKEKLKEELDEMTDKYTRLFAEFQNFRSRNEKEKIQNYEMGEKNIIEKLLPIVDNFERGIEALSEEELKSPVGEGMKLIYKQLTDTLKEMGVEEIEAEGKEFDPELHNAVMHEENDEYEENVIIEVLQKGYKFHDAVIRHSLVKVAN
jgi:molecular chaperone GrpE